MFNFDWLYLSHVVARCPQFLSEAKCNTFEHLNIKKGAETELHLSTYISV